MPRDRKFLASVRAELELGEVNQQPGAKTKKEERGSGGICSKGLSKHQTPKETNTNTQATNRIATQQHLIGSKEGPDRGGR